MRGAKIGPPDGWHYWLIGTAVLALVGLFAIVGSLVWFARELLSVH